MARLRSLSSVDLAGSQDRFERSRDFHAVLLNIGGNRLIEVIAGPVFSVLAQRYLRDDIASATWGELAADDAAITDAIGDGDSDLAVELMTRHIADVATLYRDKDS